MDLVGYNEYFFFTYLGIFYTKIFICISDNLKPAFKTSFLVQNNPFNFNHAFCEIHKGQNCLKSLDCKD